MTREEARAQVWTKLRRVARPDSRFHYDFNEYIPDFEGSDSATARLTALPCYQHAKTIFITPDNCLEDLRLQALRDKKRELVSTYGISRGIIKLESGDLPEELYEYAVLLDSLEKFGTACTLKEIETLGKIDLVVTGGSVVNTEGIRFGKGHGFFDLEWAMLYKIGVVDVDTPVVAFMHDCQVVDLPLESSIYDTICDFIVTPTRVITIQTPKKPTIGVVWDQLREGMLDSIPPLAELKEMETSGSL